MTVDKSAAHFTKLEAMYEKYSIMTPSQIFHLDETFAFSMSLLTIPDVQSVFYNQIQVEIQSLQSTGEAVIHPINANCLF